MRSRGTERVLIRRHLRPHAQAEMAGTPETAAILDALNATRASARERQDELERKIRDEARKLRQGAAAGARMESCWCLASEKLSLVEDSLWHLK